MIVTVIRTHPAENQKVIVPPEAPMPCQLAVDAQAEEDGRHNGDGPYRPQQHWGVVGHHAGRCCLGGVSPCQIAEGHGVQEVLDPHGDLTEASVGTNGKASAARLLSAVEPGWTGYFNQDSSNLCSWVLLVSSGGALTGGFVPVSMEPVGGKVILTLNATLRAPLLSIPAIRSSASCGVWSGVWRGGGGQPDVLDLGWLEDGLVTETRLPGTAQGWLCDVDPARSKKTTLLQRTRGPSTTVAAKAVDEARVSVSARAPKPLPGQACENPVHSPRNQFLFDVLWLTAHNSSISWLK